MHLSRETSTSFLSDSKCYLVVTFLSFRDHVDFASAASIYQDEVSVSRETGATCTTSVYLALKKRLNNQTNYHNAQINVRLVTRKVMLAK